MNAHNPEFSEVVGSSKWWASRAFSSPSFKKSWKASRRLALASLTIWLKVSRSNCQTTESSVAWRSGPSRPSNWWMNMSLLGCHSKFQKTRKPPQKQPVGNCRAMPALQRHHLATRMALLGECDQFDQFDQWTSSQLERNGMIVSSIDIPRASQKHRTKPVSSVASASLALSDPLSISVHPAETWSTQAYYPFRALATLLHHFVWTSVPKDRIWKCPDHLWSIGEPFLIVNKCE